MPLLHVLDAFIAQFEDATAIYTAPNLLGLRHFPSCYLTSVRYSKRHHSTFASPLAGPAVGSRFNGARRKIFRVKFGAPNAYL